MADDPKDKELKVDNVLTRDLQTSTYQASHKDEYVKEIVVDWSNVVDMMLDAKKKVDADTTAVADFKAGIVNKKNILLTTAG